MDDVEFHNPDQSGQGQVGGHVQGKSDFGIGKAALAKAIMIEEIVQMTSVFDGINHCPLPMHPP